MTACSPLPSPRRRGTPASRLRVAATRAGGEARRVRPRVPGSGRRGDEEKETTTDHAFTRAGAARCSMQMRVIVAPAVVAKGSQAAGPCKLSERAASSKGQKGRRRARRLPRDQSIMAPVRQTSSSLFQEAWSWFCGFGSCLVA